MERGIIFCNYCTEFFESTGLFVYLGEWGVGGELIMTTWISKKSPRGIKNGV